MRTDLETIKKIIQDGFLDIITDILEPSEDKLRIILKDESFVDIRISQIIRNRFDFHWEKRHLDDTIFRYDNFPDIRWKRLKSFPFHLHNGQENKVIEAKFKKSLPYAFIDFMEFIRKNI